MRNQHFDQWVVEWAVLTQTVIYDSCSVSAFIARYYHARSNVDWVMSNSHTISLSWISTHSVYLTHCYYLTLRATNDNYCNISAYSHGSKNSETKGSRSSQWEDAYRGTSDQAAWGKFSQACGSWWRSCCEKSGRWRRWILPPAEDLWSCRWMLISSSESRAALEWQFPNYTCSTSMQNIWEEELRVMDRYRHWFVVFWYQLMFMKQAFYSPLVTTMYLLL